MAVLGVSDTLIAFISSLRLQLQIELTLYFGSTYLRLKLCSPTEPYHNGKESLTLHAN